MRPPPAHGIAVDLSDAVATTYGAQPAGAPDEDDAIAKLERLAASARAVR